MLSWSSVALKGSEPGDFWCGLSNEEGLSKVADLNSCAVVLDKRSSMQLAAQELRRFSKSKDTEL
jgi:hypothetical protein